MIELTIVQPCGEYLHEEFEYIVAPGAEGDFGVLAEHTPFITKLRPGVLRLYKKQNQDPRVFAIHDGFVFIDSGKMKIACDGLESSVDIDKDRATRAKNRAQKHLDSNSLELDVRRAEYALRRAIARLDAVQRG